MPNKTTIEKTDKWYKFYLRLPLIVLILDIVVFFIWGIIDACVISIYEGYYGIVGFTNGFVCWLVWQVAGVVAGGISYIVIKVLTSCKILQVEYLKEINKNAGKNNTAE